MFGKKHGSGVIDSLIGAGSRIEGDLCFTGGLRIDGQVVGNVRGMGDKPCALVLSELAKVEGEIEVAHVTINGTVMGPVRASEYVELLSKSKVTGDVHYKSIEMHVGAIVQGRLVHEATKQEKVIELKPATGN
ncbi:MAG: polymer-forming cytoskeletal protein [Pseudomonadota bacterium]